MKLLQILLGLFRLGRDLEDYTRVERFRAILRRHGYFNQGVVRMNSEESTRAIMREKRLMSWTAADLDRLAKLPQDSLGNRFKAFLDQYGLKPLSYEKDANLTDEEFFIRRVVQTHDFWHVVLGYEANPLGEIGINCFMLAQIAWPPAAFYTGGYIIRQMLKAPQDILEVMNVITTGWSRGKATKPLFAIRWEDQLERPLAELRKELGVEV